MIQTEIILPTVVYQNRPAAHRRVVCLCKDQKFLPHPLFVANKIATEHPDRDFDICIVADTKIAPHPLFDTLAIRLVQIDTQPAARQMKIKGRIGFATYLPIFMPRLWIDDYDQLLYLDGEMSYRRGDISALFKRPLNALQHTAVPDLSYWERRNRTVRDVSREGQRQQSNLNAGVLLIDVKPFVRDRFCDAVMQLMKTYGQEFE